MIPEVSIQKWGTCDVFRRSRLFISAGQTRMSMRTDEIKFQTLASFWPETLSSKTLLHFHRLKMHSH